MSATNSTQNSSASEPSKYVKGLEGMIAGETVLSLVNGEDSRLLYRGIPVGELTHNSTYEETVYFLWNGKFPVQAELDEFKKSLAQQRQGPEALLKIIKEIPTSANPMGALRTLVSLLALFDPQSDKIDMPNLHRVAARLVAVIPTLIAAFHRNRQGKSPIGPDPSLSHAANFLYMMNGEKPAKEMERALDAYLILLADHGFNASTFSARVTIATQSDMFSAVTSAIGTLKGDLHGSANQRAMEMILDIGSPDRAEAYVRDLLAKKKKVMGFGHRIYKKEDPRATAFRSIANELCERVGEKKWMEISNRVEKVMHDDKGIPCNVDFFSSTVLYILGFPVDFFTTVFAASRVAGWTAHVIEQLSDNRLIRPQAVYTGPQEQHYVPMGQRK